jgi:hypothetical protein
MGPKGFESTEGVETLTRNWQKATGTLKIFLLDFLRKNNYVEWNL